MKRLPFSLPMVRAFRAGLKTQTRRVRPPRFEVGEIVAIAEPCRVEVDSAEHGWVWCRYEVDGSDKPLHDKAEWLRCHKMTTVINRTPRSARFMPGWAERSRVRITEIRQEALGDITEADAVREGFGSRDAFLDYFATLHPGPVDLALPVWVVSFEVVT